MSRHILPSLALTVVCVLAGSAAPAAAQEDADFTFRLDPIVLEGLWHDQDTTSSKFQEYRDLSDGFRLALLSLTGSSADFRRQLDFTVVNGGRDDGFYGLTYDVGGSWRMRASYDLIPHRFGNNGRLLWTRTGPGVFELADPVQQALEQFTVDNRSLLNFDLLRQAIAPFLATAHEVDLGLQRHRSRLTLDLGRAGNGSWTIDYQHERRSGNRPYGASFGFNNVTELPEPIEYDTTNATVAGAWKWERGVATAGYRYSTFDNDVSTMYWDNPWRATDATDSSAYSAPGPGSIGGSRRGFADLAADNQAGSLFANGRFQLTESSWLQAALQWTRYEQDDDLLPYTLNTAINPTTGAPFDASDPANQPHGSADREAELLNLVADYGLRFGDGWQLGLRFNHRDYDDSSERLEFEGYVRFHAVWEEIGRITVPSAWTQQTLSARLDKSFAAVGDLGLELRRETWERELREVEETTEDVVALTWDRRFGKAMARAKYERGDRDLDSPYLTEAQEASFLHPEGINNQPGLRKFDEAARKTDRWNVSVDLPLGDAWSVGARVSGSEFDYDESLFGLTGDEVVRYGVDLNWQVAAGSTVALFAERANREVEQAARQSGGTLSINPLDDWFAEFEEANDTWGLSWTREAAPWHSRLVAERVESDGEADLFSPPGGTPDLALGFGNYEDYERTTFEGVADYDLTESFAVGARVLYEDYTIDSFIRQDLANYLPGALLLVGDDGEYEAWSAGLRMKVSF